MAKDEMISIATMWDLGVTARSRQLFVLPFYMSLLNGNFVSRQFADYDDAHSQRIAHTAKAISDGQLKRLLKTREWRGRLSAGWFVGLSQRSGFIERIAGLLLDSEVVHAGQGYCVALGLIGGESCRNHLREYLKKYLPLRGRYYDQHWAIGALAHIQGTPSQEFLDPALWEETTESRQPFAAIQRFEELVTYLQQHRMIASKA